MARGLKKFVIKEGRHYTKSLVYMLKFIFSRRDSLRMSFDFRLGGSTAVYKIIKQDQKDINKISGYSMGWDHQQNSIRIGWRYDIRTGLTQILAYCYDGGVRSWVPLHWYGHSIGWDNTFTVHLKTDTSNHHITLIQDTVVLRKLTIPRVQDNYNYRWGKVLRPYFGGTSKAPYDMEVKLLINK
jgi:hypothetical protein